MSRSAAREPAIALNALSGGISVHDDTVYVEKLALRTSETSLSIDGAVQNYLTKPDLNLQITSDKLSIPEIARARSCARRRQAAAGVRDQGERPARPAGRRRECPHRRPGDLVGQVVADLSAPGQSVQGDVAVRHLDLGKLLNDPKQKSDIAAMHTSTFAPSRSRSWTRCAAVVDRCSACGLRELCDWPGGRHRAGRRPTRRPVGEGAGVRRERNRQGTRDAARSG